MCVAASGPASALSRAHSLLPQSRLRVTTRARSSDARGLSREPTRELDGTAPPLPFGWLDFRKMPCPGCGAAKDEDPAKSAARALTSRLRRLSRRHREEPG